MKYEKKRQIIVVSTLATVVCSIQYTDDSLWMVWALTFS